MAAKLSVEDKKSAKKAKGPAASGEDLDDVSDEE